MYCPCVSLRHASFMLALSAYVAVQSAAIFGVSALQIAVAAERGEALSFAIATVWVMSVTLGLYWAVVGYRATLTHVDLEGMSAALSIGAIALCFWILRYSGFTSEIGRAVTVAFLANNVTNMCLQLRGILPRKQRRYQQHSPDPELHLLIEELAAERDRLVLELEHRPPPSAEMQRVFQHPGMRRAVLSLVHPDRAQTDAERLKLTPLFQSASSFFDRIAVR